MFPPAVEICDPLTCSVHSVRHFWFCPLSLSISSTLYTVNSDFPHSTLHSKGAQGSVRCGPPETAPPALPGSEDTPDVVPPLYADLDTLKVYTCLFCSTVLSSESSVIVFH